MGLGRVSRRLMGVSWRWTARGDAEKERGAASHSHFVARPPKRSVFIRHGPSARQDLELPTVEGWNQVRWVSLDVPSG
jgi:hypothetical protein